MLTRSDKLEIILEELRKSGIKVFNNYKLISAIDEGLKLIDIQGMEVAK